MALQWYEEIPRSMIDVPVPTYVDLETWEHGLLLGQFKADDAPIIETSPLVTNHQPEPSAATSEASQENGLGARLGATVKSIFKQDKD